MTACTQSLSAQTGDLYPILYVSIVKLPREHTYPKI